MQFRSQNSRSATKQAKFSRLSGGGAAEHGEERNEIEMLNEFARRMRKRKRKSIRVPNETSSVDRNQSCDNGYPIAVQENKQNGASNARQNRLIRGTDVNATHAIVFCVRRKHRTEFSDRTVAIEHDVY